jgi:hypothetical protein
VAQTVPNSCHGFGLHVAPVAREADVTVDEFRAFVRSVDSRRFARQDDITATLVGSCHHVIQVARDGLGVERLVSRENSDSLTGFVVFRDFEPAVRDECGVTRLSFFRGETIFARAFIGGSVEEHIDQILLGVFDHGLLGVSGVRRPSTLYTMGAICINLLAPWCNI